MKGKLGRVASECEETGNQSQKVGRQGGLPETEVWAESCATEEEEGGPKDCWLQDEVLESDISKPTKWPSDVIKPDFNRLLPSRDTLMESS